ncbi:Mss4-like protein [Armillaria solidipes]|uniref:Mss4-like protein n=1 Tax=Armillaria solidipes TaxID=1076256 RepID=A0A2H3CGZ6_9AGAR|nr:Mss4-like protein [Armillaria solidipes]
MSVSHDQPIITPFEPVEQSDQDLSPAVLAALRGCSPTRPTPPLRLFTTFENGVADVSHKHYAIGDYPDMLTNKYQLVCPRDECRSIILREGVARLEEREAVQMQPSHLELHPLMLPIPEAPEKSSWWLVGPTPMEFDNIGFSKTVDSIPLSPNGKKIKLLSCAECDLGPIGWCEEGGKEFWLACSRVGYRYIE